MSRKKQAKCERYLYYLNKKGSEKMSNFTTKELLTAKLFTIIINT